MSKYQIFLDIVFLFFFGACAGWVLELLFRKFFSGSNPEHKWLNPGFLFGPCVPLYGIGTVVLFGMSLVENAVFGSFSGSVGYYFVMFFIMALVMTLIEYLVGLLSIHVMGIRLWDYSHCWGNIQGIICPLFSLYWAIGGALYYFLIHPRILTALDWLSRNLAFSFFIGMFFGVFVIDFAHSANLIAKLKAFAEENDVVVRYEAVKLQVRRAQEKAKAKYHFFRPFDSEMPLHEHLKQMAATLEKRKSKTRKES